MGADTCILSRRCAKGARAASYPILDLVDNRIVCCRRSIRILYRAALIFTPTGLNCSIRVVQPAVRRDVQPAVQPALRSQLRSQMLSTQWKMTDKCKYGIK